MSWMQIGSMLLNCGKLYLCFSDRMREVSGVGDSIHATWHIKKAKVITDL